MFFVEETNQVAFDFEKLVWVLFYLCQSTKVLKFIASFVVHPLTPAPFGTISVLGILLVLADPVNRDF
jgi:hypothetical protein